MGLEANRELMFEYLPESCPRTGEGNIKAVLTSIQQERDIILKVTSIYFSFKNSNVSFSPGTTFLIAGAAHKMTMPIRLPITVFLTPFVKRGIHATPGGKAFMERMTGLGMEKAKEAKTAAVMLGASTKGIVKCRMSEAIQTI
jgi:hypothetical protein